MKISNLFKNLYLQFAAALIILLVTSVLSFRNTTQLIEALRWSEHTYQVIQKLDTLLSSMIASETSQRGYIIIGEEEYLNAYSSAVNKARQTLTDLKLLTVDNPVQQKYLEEVSPLIAEKLFRLQQRIDIFNTRGRNAALLEVRTGPGKKLLREIQNIFSQMNAEEEKLLAARGRKAMLETRRVIISIVTGTIASLTLFSLVFLLLNREIASRRKIENEINKLNDELKSHVKQLEAANQELDAFTYTVSHDLRTPLRAIDGFSRIIVEEYADKLDDEGKRLLNVVRKNTVNMGDLIDDLLSFSRLGRQELRPVIIDMQNLAESIFEDLKISLHDQNRKLNLNIKSMPSALSDLGLMRQVLVNLISNAIKYTRHKETAAIEIGGRSDDRENIYYIKDNGIGFDMKYVHKLFGVFQRLCSPADFEGTGVGLAIVRRVINRHGGRVWAESKLNEGAVFYFALPKKRETQHG